MGTIIHPNDVSTLHMDNVIKDYNEAIKNYIEVSQKETRIKILVQQARAKLKKAKQELFATENELLDITYKHD